MKLHRQDGKVRGNERYSGGGVGGEGVEKNSGDSFKETKGNEAMGRSGGRLKVADWFMELWEKIPCVKIASVLERAEGNESWSTLRLQDIHSLLRRRPCTNTTKSAIVMRQRSWLLVTASSCFFSTDTHRIYLSYAWPHSTESWNLNEEKQKVITNFWVVLAYSRISVSFLKKL